MADNTVVIINNSNAVKYAAGVRLDPGWNEITPQQYEACKQTAAWEEWMNEGELELNKGNQYATEGSGDKRTEKFTTDDIPLHDFEAKEQHKKRQEIFKEDYTDPDWLQRQVDGLTAAGKDKTDAIKHIAEWCGVTPRTIRNHMP